MTSKTPPNDHSHIGSLATRSSLTGLINSLKTISPPSHEDFPTPSSPQTAVAVNVGDVFDTVTQPLLADDDDEPSFSAKPTAHGSWSSMLGEDSTRPVGASAMGAASFLKRSGGIAPPAVPAAPISLERAASTSSTAKEKAHDIAIAAVYGVINSIVTIPITLSFAAIIFQHPLYQPVLGPLVKLVFLSCALHQLVFVVFSTLPFAVGQVQDVGLLFLSSMASAIAVTAPAAGYTVQQTVATMLICLTTSTAIVGLLIIVTGYMKLAQLVQYLPLPVVGGYLGFVGYFCFASGVSLATNMRIASPASWIALCQDRGALLLLAPAVLTWLVLWVGTARFRHPLALPLLLCAVPLVFYAVLYGMGYTLEDAQRSGWVKPPSEQEVHQFWKVWQVYNISEFPSGVYWAALPAQAGLLAALFFVVAFGSSMDVAAVQQNHACPLDYNRELITVGISNLVTGMAGCGFTGSYIFSQTIFSQRMGVKSRVNGIVIVLFEGVLFVLPCSIIQFFPSYFFGGLMIWVGVDILKDWLLLSYHKVRLVEFGLLWVTFLLICGLGLELGIALGIVGACLLFAYSYARVHVHTFSVLPSRSGSARGYEERTVLNVLNKRITAVSLSGYIFFGSSIKISDKVQQLAMTLLQSDKQVDTLAVTGRVASHWDLTSLQVSNIQTLPGAVGQLDQQTKALGYAAFATAPRYMLLDFRRVNGLDATAAQTFSTLARSLASMSIQLILTHVSVPEVRQLLIAHGVINQHAAAPGYALTMDGETTVDGEATTTTAGHQPTAASGPGACRYYPSMDEGLQACEEELLTHARACGLLPQRAVERMSVQECMRGLLVHPEGLLPGGATLEQVVREVPKFLTIVTFPPQTLLFDMGHPSDGVFFILSGRVVCQVMQSGVRLRQPFHGVDNKQGYMQTERVRDFVNGPGTLIGDMDFMAGKPRRFRAIARTTVEAAYLTRDAYATLAKKNPGVLNVLQAAMLRSIGEQLAYTLDLLYQLDLADG